MQPALTHLRASDPVMARLIDEIGPYAIEFLEPDFATLAKAIVLQQLSGKVAEIIFNRLVVAAAGDGRLTPQGVLKLRTQKLRALGLSRQKIGYLRELARRTISGQVDFAVLAALPDEEVHQRLTALKGIGPWTVHMFLIFALRRLDVMPSADLGIRAAVRKVYGLAQMPLPAEVDRLARKWKPYSSVASWYLWRSLETKAGL
ncbi:MAG: DNA-3-methyladenine glycosylase 2 family protein [Bryobacteraceae bacterium]